MLGLGTRLLLHNIMCWYNNMNVVHGASTFVGEMAFIPCREAVSISQRLAFFFVAMVLTMNNHHYYVQGLAMLVNSLRVAGLL